MCEISDELKLCTCSNAEELKIIGCFIVIIKTRMN